MGSPAILAMWSMSGAVLVRTQTAAGKLVFAGCCLCALLTWSWVLILVAAVFSFSASGVQRRVALSAGLVLAASVGVFHDLQSLTVRGRIQLHAMQHIASNWPTGSGTGGFAWSGRTPWGQSTTGLPHSFVLYSGTTFGVLGLLCAVVLVAKVIWTVAQGHSPALRALGLSCILLAVVDIAWLSPAFLVLLALLLALQEGSEAPPLQLWNGDGNRQALLRQAVDTASRRTRGTLRLEQQSFVAPGLRSHCRTQSLRPREGFEPRYFVESFSVCRRVVLPHRPIGIEDSMTVLGIVRWARRQPTTPSGARTDDFRQVARCYPATSRYHREGLAETVPSLPVRRLGTPAGSFGLTTTSNMGTVH